MNIKKLKEKAVSIASDRIIFSSSAPVHVSMRTMLAEGIGFKVVLGSYKGMTETSFIIDSADLEKVSLLLIGQESILSLSCPQKDRTREMQLIFVETNDNDYIGMLTTMTADEALATDAWTYAPDLGVFFGAKVPVLH